MVRAANLAVGGEALILELSAADEALVSTTLEPHFLLTRRQLVSLVFGAHPAQPFDPRAVLHDLFPFHLPIRVLDRS